MSFEMLALPAVILVAITSLLLLISLDWRLSIGALAAQSVGVFVLVGISWPVEMATAKLVAGWMAGAVLGMAVVSLPRGEGFRMPASADTTAGLSLPTGRVFRLLAAVLVWLTILSLAPRLADWVPGVSLMQTWGALALVGAGLLQLGFTAQPLRTILGLLTILSGFEILYAAVESSALVAGLLAGVTLALSLSGAYLLLSPHMVEEAE